ncbi:MAG: hypothetical protein ACE5JX_06840 [Acidobacteriota bacterium]
MAHIWIADSTDGYAVAELDGKRFTLCADTNNPVARATRGTPGSSPANDLILLAKSARNQDVVWLLLGGVEARVHLNGEPLVAGMAVLADRDEIRISGGARFYFSTEELARVEPLPSAMPTTHCPRCQDRIEEACPSVRCPACGVWHHQHEAGERLCWTYGETCASCRVCSTNLESVYRWSPGCL